MTPQEKQFVLDCVKEFIAGSCSRVKPSKIDKEKYLDHAEELMQLARKRGLFKPNS